MNDQVVGAVESFPFIVVDGIGVDISPVMIDVVNACVEKAYGGSNIIFLWERETG